MATYSVKMYHPDIGWTKDLVVTNDDPQIALETAILRFNFLVENAMDVEVSEKFWLADFKRVTGAKMQYAIFDERGKVVPNLSRYAKIKIPFGSGIQGVWIDTICRGWGIEPEWSESFAVLEYRGKFKNHFLADVTRSGLRYEEVE